VCVYAYLCLRERERNNVCENERDIEGAMNFYPREILHLPCKNRLKLASSFYLQYFS
jgi:hypothetical protein